MGRTVKVTGNDGAFYGWAATGGAALVYFATSGIFYYAYGVFLPAICEEYGWSRALVGGILSVGLLAFGLPSPLISVFISRFGPRANIIFGNLLVVGGLASMSVIREVWQFYLCYGVLVGLGAGFATYMTCTTVVNNWFIKKRSLAMGFIISAGGFGGFAFPPLAAWLILNFGLRAAWLILAMIQLVLGLVVGGIILVRNRPEDMRQMPDGISEEHPIRVKDELGNATKGYQTPVDWQTRQAIREPATWLIATFSAVSALAVGAVTAHLVAYLKEFGFSTLEAAMSLGLASGASIAGRLGFGLLGVRFHPRHLAIVSCLAQVVAFLILLSARSPCLIYIYAMMFGISYGALAVALPVFVGAYYGRAYYTQILGIMFPLTILADAAGPIMGGAVHDAVGTYVPAFTVITGLSTIGLVCAFLAYPPRFHEPATEGTVG